VSRFSTVNLTSSRYLSKFKKFDSIIIVTYAFFVSLTLSYLRGISLNFSQDSKDYISGANNLQNGITWILNNPDQFAKPLGLPFQILILKTLFGVHWLIGFKVLSALLHALTAVLLYKICLLLEVRKKLALFCGLLFASDPLILVSTTDITTETIATLTITFWCYWAMLKVNRISVSNIHKIGFVLVSIFCITTRPNYLFILFAVLILLIIKQNLRILRSSEIVAFILFFTVFQAFILFLYKSFILIAPGSGLGMYFFCRGELNQQAIGIIDEEKNASLNTWVLQSLTNQSDIFFSTNPNGSFSEFNQFLSSEGLKYCLSNPGEGLVSVLIRGVGNWRPFVAFGAYGLSTFVISFVILGSLLLGTAFFIFGRKTKAQDHFMHFFLATSLAFTLSILVTPTQIRHKVAFSESIMLICCTLAMQNYLNARQKRN